MPFAVNPQLGVVPRVDARCPVCKSLERHRLVMIFLRSETDLFDGKEKKFLHVAPEVFLAPILSEATGAGYLTADLMDDNVMEKMDITDIQHPDNSFDVIYCSHVLEHVSADQQAMREFFRILKPGGWAILNVPITVETTIEDATVQDPDERLRLFGQRDHVRRYGRDYIDRLRDAGFEVEEYGPRDLLNDADVTLYGLTNASTGSVFYCRKGLEVDS